MVNFVVEVICCWNEYQ